MAYQFESRGDESTYEAVHRLAGDVGWHVEFDDEATAKLRAHKARRVRASRSECTRAEFIARLCADAHVTFVAPERSAA